MKPTITKNAKQTMALAARLLPDILSKKIVLLSGPLGSGKTTFVKGLAKALGMKQSITSPTYTYLNTYKIPNITLYHFDLYRLPETLRHFPELDEAVARTDGIVIVEWPEKIELVTDAVILKFSTLQGGKRRIERCDTL